MRKAIKLKLGIGFLLVLEIGIIATFLLFLMTDSAIGDVGQNVNVRTQLTIGNVFPEILNLSVDNGATSIVLIANSTKLVNCNALIRDYNNETDIKSVYAEFFDTQISEYGDPDDMNNHYTQAECYLNRSFISWGGYLEDDYTLLAQCNFSVYYSANPGNWNCSFIVNDTADWQDSATKNISIAELLAIGLPNSIDYGLVNATYVSNEQMANVTNFGNVAINLSLKGYGAVDGDGLAMNCTLGATKNISVSYMRYNLTESTVGDLSLSEFGLAYINLTSNAIVKKFNLNYRQNDVFNEAVNSSYWRVYVPRGVAGTCSGNIVFGAVKSQGS